MCAATNMQISFCKWLVLFAFLQIADRLFVPLVDENGVNVDITSFRSPADIGNTLVRAHA